VCADHDIIADGEPRIRPDKVDDTQIADDLVVDDLGIETLNVDSESIEDRRESFTDGVGFDVVSNTTGHHTSVEMAADQVRKGGQVVVGLPGESSDLFSYTVRDPARAFESFLNSESVKPVFRFDDV
jgi:L-iditol 2-dehydrogenase